MAKATKAEAKYIAQAKGRFCRDCTMWRPPQSCTAVEGTISPRATCRFFRRRRKAAPASLPS